MQTFIQSILQNSKTKYFYILKLSIKHLLFLYWFLWFHCFFFVSLLLLSGCIFSSLSHQISFIDIVSFILKMGFELKKRFRIVKLSCLIKSSGFLMFWKFKRNLSNNILIWNFSRNNLICHQKFNHYFLFIISFVSRDFTNQWSIYWKQTWRGQHSEWLSSSQLICFSLAPSY